MYVISKAKLEAWLGKWYESALKSYFISTVPAPRFITSLPNFKDMYKVCRSKCRESRAESERFFPEPLYEKGGKCKLNVMDCIHQTSLYSAIHHSRLQFRDLLVVAVDTLKQTPRIGCSFRAEKENHYQNTSSNTRLCKNLLVIAVNRLKQASRI